MAKQTEPFIPVPASDKQQETLNVLSMKFYELSCAVKALTPPSHYQSLMLTALEEAAMWASKAVMQRED